MNFLIVSHTPHRQKANQLYAYAPYVREINLWIKHVHKVEVLAPKIDKESSSIQLEYKHDNIEFNAIHSINFISIKNTLFSVLKIPGIMISMIKAFRKADHIHLRCPGNIGLIGCVVQIFFPKKVKTAKYAGNWDPDAKQPLSYKIQRWILRNTFLTRNMQVLVYGQWRGQTQNVKPFFTASYRNSEMVENIRRNYKDRLRFVFVGSLVKGKRPLFAVKMIERLVNQGIMANLEIYGDGILNKELEGYIVENNLTSTIALKGNKTKKEIMGVLKNAHFLILPSKSEGWPKVVAEAMFFGTISIATNVSCVPYMLDAGKRGILIEPNLDHATQCLIEHLRDEKGLNRMSDMASKWSRMYTLEFFEDEVIKLLKTSNPNF